MFTRHSFVELGRGFDHGRASEASAAQTPRQVLGNSLTTYRLLPAAACFHSQPPAAAASGTDLLHGPAPAPLPCARACPCRCASASQLAAARCTHARTLQATTISSSSVLTTSQATHCTSRPLPRMIRSMVHPALSQPVASSSAGSSTKKPHTHRCINSLAAKATKSRDHMYVITLSNEQPEAHLITLSHENVGHRPWFWGHSTYRRGLPRHRGTDAPHLLWIGVLRGREVSGSTRGAGTAVTAGEVPQL